MTDSDNYDDYLDTDPFVYDPYTDEWTVDLGGDMVVPLSEVLDEDDLY